MIRRKLASISLRFTFVLFRKEQAPLNRGHRYQGPLTMSEAERDQALPTESLDPQSCNEESTSLDATGGPESTEAAATAIENTGTIEPETVVAPCDARCADGPAITRVHAGNCP